MSGRQRGDRIRYPISSVPTDLSPWKQLAAIAAKRHGEAPRGQPGGQTLLGALRVVPGRLLSVRFSGCVRRPMRHDEFLRDYLRGITYELGPEGARERRSSLRVPS